MCDCHVQHTPTIVPNKKLEFCCVNNIYFFGLPSLLLHECISNLNYLNSYDHGLSTPLTVMMSDPIVEPATLLFVIYAM